MNYTIRHRDGGLLTVEEYTTGKAVRAMCTECMGWETDPKDCTSPKCPLFPFRKRFFKSISRHEATEMTEDKKEALRDRVRKMHAAKKQAKLSA